MDDGCDDCALLLPIWNGRNNQWPVRDSLFLMLLQKLRRLFRTLRTVRTVVPLIVRDIRANLLSFAGFNFQHHSACRIFPPQTRNDHDAGYKTIPRMLCYAIR